MIQHKDPTTEAPARTLLPHHRETLEKASGIDPAVIAERGYFSAPTWKELDGLRFKGHQKRPQCFPALVIPNHGPDGELTYHTVRWERPHVRQNGKEVRYEQPEGVPLHLDVPPRCLAGLRDPEQPIWWTEGAKKADSLASRGIIAVNTPGVDGWRSPNAIPDAFGLPLKGRAVVCAYDSDAMTKPAVHNAVKALARWMAQRGAVVRVVDWRRADLPEGSKTGVDDFLGALGHTLEELRALVVPFDEWLKEPEPDQQGPSTAYQATPAGLVWAKPTKEGTVPVPLTNFVARIAADVAEDDGTGEVRRRFELQAGLHGRVRSFHVPAERFAAMNWAVEHLGAGAIIYPGLGTKDHARAAIQLLSGCVPERRVFAHTGWRRLEGGWAFLHAGGAIGADGAVDGLEVTLPASLAGYRLPPPPEGDDLARAIVASIGILDVAPARVTIPLLSVVFRAAIGESDFSLHLAGPTGAGKSELAALAQQHFGAGMDARHLPAGWSGTGNALEGLAFQSKDVVLTVDDFAPNGALSDVQKIHAAAERLLRGQGNRSGRLRMHADGSLRTPRPPRGIVLSTGEDVPKGQSLRSRLLVVELGPDDLDWTQLTDCQRDAAAGTYAGTLSAFLRWLAPQRGQVTARLQEDVARLRQAAYESGQHRRLPGIVADLALGLQHFITFARETGTLNEAQATHLWETGWAALGETAKAQATHQASSEPTRRFLELLGSALASGQAHIAAPGGAEPRTPEAWGWRLYTVGTGSFERDEWRPQGMRVGWIEGDDLYVDADAAYSAARRLGADASDGLVLTLDTLKRRLKERGLLASIEHRGGRDRLEVRRTLEGRRREVLHLHADCLVSHEVAHVAQDPPGTPKQHNTGNGDEAAGPLSWATNPGATTEVAHESGPEPQAQDNRANSSIAPGPLGPLGPHSGTRRAAPASANGENDIGDALDLAARAGWPSIRFKPGESVPAGEAPWRLFVQVNPLEDVRLVREALAAHLRGNHQGVVA